MVAMELPAHLQGSWPRQSTAQQTLIFQYQPLKLFYQLFFITTFPIRLFLIMIPKTLHQRFIDDKAPQNYRYLDLMGIEIARVLISSFYLPTGGGPRGTHYSAPISKSLQLKHLKSSKSLVDVIHPKIQVNGLREPVRSWAKNAGVKVANDLTLWWLGKRSQQAEQPKAKKDERIMLYLSG
jgi:hypothetical protein